MESMVEHGSPAQPAAAAALLNIICVLAWPQPGHEAAHQPTTREPAAQRDCVQTF